MTLVKMDFNSLLNQATKNVKTTTKTLGKIDTEVSKERSKEIERLKREKMEKRRREEAAARKREEERIAAEKKFCIPKKKPEGSTVDAKGIQAFLAKKEEEKRKQAKIEAEKKEQLIKLRLEANGGKANKKIAKHFGKDVVDLQVKYGQDRGHIETLVKYKEREQEEADKLAAHYRDGVASAFAHKKKMEERIKEGARVKNSGLPKKSLTIVANDGFEAGKKTSKQSSIPNTARKRAAPEQLDFETLMKKAASVAKGEEEPKSSTQSYSQSYRSSESLHPPRPSYSKPPSSSSAKMSDKGKKEETKTRREGDRKDQGGGSTSYSKNSYSSSTMSKPKPGVDVKRSNPPSKPSLPSSAPPTQHASSSSSSSVPYPVDARGKRILPGDIRYKEWLAEQKAKGVSVPTCIRTTPKPATPSPFNSSVSRPSLPSKSSSSSHSLPPPRMREKEKDQRHTSSYERERKEEMMRAEERRQREKERERRERERAKYDKERSMLRYRRGSSSEEDEDEEEEDGSDLDDFIDDSGDIDEFMRTDLEETLKSINKNYDKKKWKMNERMIDERKMHSDWRTVEKEERASARAALKEDLREALKGKSRAL